MIDRAAAAQAGGSPLHSPPRAATLAARVASGRCRRGPRARAPIRRPRGAASPPVVFSGPAFGSRYAVRVVMAVGDEPANEKVRGRSRARSRSPTACSRAGIRVRDLAAERARLDGALSGLARDARGARARSARERELSQGAFDATVLPLVEAWGFGPHAAIRTPRPTTSSGAPRARGLPAARARRGPLDRGQGAARRGVRRLGDRRRLGGGPDRARDRGARPPRRARGRRRRGGGARPPRADGGRWRVAVSGPTGPGAHAGARAGRRRSRHLGDYRKVWTDAEGHRLSHILDPRTGRPVAHDLASVTVVDADGAWADALATTLMVLGPDAGRALAARERLPHASWCGSRTGSSPSGRRRRSSRSSPLPARPSRPAARSFSVC